MEAPTVSPLPLEAPPAKPKLSGVAGVLILTQLLSLGLSCFLGAAFGSGVAAEHRAALAAGTMTQVEFGALLMANPDFLIGVFVFSQLATGLALWQGMRLFDDVPPGQHRWRLGWNEDAVRWRDVALLTVGSLAVGSLVVGSIRLIEGAPATGAIANLNAASSSSSPAQFAMLLLFGAVGAALTEELLFRGYVQQRFVERWGPVAGVLATSFLFGLWHFDLRQGLFAAALGCWLGFGALRCGTVVTGALAHLVNNATSFLGNRLWPQRDEEGLAVTIALSAVVLAACVVGLVRSTRPAATPPEAPPA